MVLFRWLCKGGYNPLNVQADDDKKKQIRKCGGKPETSWEVTIWMAEAKIGLYCHMYE
jgi:hypothetical protein